MKVQWFFINAVRKATFYCRFRFVFQEFGFLPSRDFLRIFCLPRSLGKFLILLFQLVGLFRLASAATDSSLLQLQIWVVLSSEHGFFETHYAVLEVVDFLRKKKYLVIPSWGKNFFSPLSALRLSLRAAGSQRTSFSSRMRTPFLIKVILKVKRKLERKLSDTLWLLCVWRLLWSTEKFTWLETMRVSFNPFWCLNNLNFSLLLRRLLSNPLFWCYFPNKIFLIEHQFQAFKQQSMIIVRIWCDSLHQW